MTHFRYFMKNITGNIALLFVVIAVAKPAIGFGQDFFRDLGTSRSSGGLGPVTPSDYTYEDSSPSGLKPIRPGQDLSVPEESEETDKYNFALGSFRFGLAAGVGIEYNDNITLAEHDRESDFIFRPVVNLDSEWRISDLNTLRFNVGASYAAYFSHTQYDPHGILLSPNSEIALTLYVASLKITFRDRFSYQNDAYDIPQLSNVAIYSRYENQAGIQFDWSVNQTFSLTFGYDHYNLWAFDKSFQTLDRGIETIYAKPAYLIGQNVTVGVTASASYIYYLHPGQNDGVDTMAGLYANIGITKSTQLDLEAGYQGLTFDRGGAIDDNSDDRTWYARAELDHQLTEYFTDHVMFSKSAELGFGENYYDLYHAEYGANWRIIRELTLTPSLFYEHYQTDGPQSEIGNRYGAAIGARWVVTSTVTLGADYRFLLNNSNLPGFGYQQDLVMLSAFYSF